MTPEFCIVGSIALVGLLALIACEIMYWGE